ncbi:hypothetical protein K7X08_031425 [Anisodus acutangulus]|uniref:ALIX V-shaped domain-containing protein n=1 Tax=Anisodus acutangulus TaxID=402998 RepID=A0A9Q1MPN2_9SOLA|nr:hypothetical protein K7X08_031425 [Anisodus acutangulus]
MDRSNAVKRQLFGCQEGTHVDRIRSSIMSALKKQLKELMMDFQGLKKTWMDECKEIGYGEGDEESLPIAIQRQLETLGAQRAGLEDMLKEMKSKEDILPKLMTATGSHEDLFRKEIAKYDHICEEISQNIEAQEQLLLQIQAQNEEFASIFNLEDYKASRERIYKHIEAAIFKYREIKENINEGLKFYATLQEAITNVKQQCSDFVMTRNIQCREMIDELGIRNISINQHISPIPAEFIGIPLQKPFLEAQLELVNGSRKEYPSSGINFASSGSGLLPSTNQDLGVTPIQDQLQQFKTLVQQKHINKKQIQQSLFLFGSGTNDIFKSFYPFDTPTLTPDAYVQAMLTQSTNFVDQICKLGARRIALFSLGPVGCVPARTLLPGAPVDKCYGKMNKMVKNYNMGLENLGKTIPMKYPGCFAVYGDVYEAGQTFRANPKRYGFSDVTNACCGGGTLGGLVQCGKEGYKLCAKPNEYLFWDYFHPSEHTYKLISKALWSGTHSRIRPVNLKTLANMTLLQL